MDTAKTDRGRGSAAFHFAWVLLSLSLLAATPPLWSEEIRLRVVAVNPSLEKTQTAQIRTELPKEVTSRDILDAGELEIEYDDARSLYYAFKNKVDLAPGETKVFEVVINDVWLIAADRLKALEDRTNAVMGHLKDTPYFSQADIIAKTVFGRLDNIRRTQSDPNVSRQQHIAYFRENTKIMDDILVDIERLEKMLVAVGGPPNIDMLEKSKIDLKSPSQKTTWIVIAVILVFIFILAGAFFFTWHTQAQTTENIFSREKKDSFSEFKKPKAPGTEDAPPPPKT